MPGDPYEYRKHAEHCWQLAAATENPVLQQSFIDLAQKWATLARDNKTAATLLEQWDIEWDRRTG